MQLARLVVKPGGDIHSFRALCATRYGLMATFSTPSR